MTKTEAKKMYKYFTAMMNNSHRRNDMVAYDEYTIKRFNCEKIIHA